MGIFVHFSENNHTINWAETKKIAYSHNALERNIIESSFIEESYCNNVNVL